MRRKSREAGRKDRAHGLHLAELAILSLESCAEGLGDQLPALEARGWAWLGNARRLALDFSGAEEALQVAVSKNRPRNVLAEGEIYLYQASLRLYQRRFDEALGLIGRAVESFEGASERYLLAQALIVRANIGIYSGKVETAVPDLKKAIRIARDNDPFLHLSATMNLATAYALLRSFQLAAGLLPQVKELCSVTGSRLVFHQLQWLKALTEIGIGRTSSAGKLLNSAREGFLEINEVDYAAVVSLELAILFQKSGRPKNALKLASQALPVFEALNIHGEATAALELLTSSVEAQEVPISVLRQARTRMVQLKILVVP
ncbi:MAG: hypothetical protein AAF657_23360 [Acidobacteriota bacterium]